ncbi:hypothetical protein I6F35_02600 [Bradyrhizobium sp. BRP22]|uniref:hypothetical protein n=1 Tax=Bradyrhizobium sp. BRP22 TaxID=2793821 RepID=UPI001CD277DC|nr:hypothetical protein [Bradyrhizobium sp. BRP22]MCA1452103.1 hypothetical protein [Bradyrhizobium sp. BRP22]
MAQSRLPGLARAPEGPSRRQSNPVQAVTVQSYVQARQVSKEIVMATLPIYLEVEDVAVGPVLIALKKMPGIIKLHLALLDEKPVPAARPGGMNTEQTVVAMFANRNGGPMTVDEVQAELGGTRTRSYSAIGGLKKKGVLQQIGKSTYKFSAKAMQMMSNNAPANPTAAPALPKPQSHPPAKKNGHVVAKAKAKKGGRAERGAGLTALRELLSQNGAMKFTDIRTELSQRGVKEKSTRGIVDRARRDGLLKKTSNGDFELTAKGASSASQSSQLQLGVEA